MAPTSTSISRRNATWTLCATAAWLGGGLALSARAAGESDYPNRPIKWITGSTGGSGGDVMARLIATDVAKILNQPIVLENKPGAAGNIATSAVANAKPDGYTLLFNYTSHVINPSLGAVMPFDPIKDFTPITMLAVNWTLLIVRGDSPAKSVADLINLARSKPGALSVGVLQGSVTHVAAELMFSELGLNVLSVPYKSNNDAVNALMGKNIDFVFSTYGPVEGFLQSGQLRALASTELKRSDKLPGVPTMAETIPGFSVTGWYGLVGPKGLPADIVSKLNGAVKQVLDSPDIREKLAKVGSQPAPTTPQEFESFIAAEIPRWQKVIKRVKVQ